LLGGSNRRGADAVDTSIRRWDHLDARHHAPVLVLEDVAVIDELAKFPELDVEAVGPPPCPNS
jgi:hypothetical protein